MESKETALKTRKSTFQNIRAEFTRKDSVMAVPGREGAYVEKGSYQGRAVGVFTSGGDAQGKKGL